MKLFRLDATHESDGAFTLLFRTPCEAAERTPALSRAGWYWDLYVSDFGPLGPEQVELLSSLPWPIVGEERILALLSNRQNDVGQDDNSAPHHSADLVTAGDQA